MGGNFVAWDFSAELLCDANSMISLESVMTRLIWEQHAIIDLIGGFN